DADTDLIIPFVPKNIDFLKVSHHGSKNQTSSNFIGNTDIKHAVISVGKNNYGHPAKETLKLFADNDIPCYRTDIEGTVSVKYYLKRWRMINFYRPYNIDDSFVSFVH